MLDLNENWLRLNNSFKKDIVFRVGISAGFFSEYNNMILVMMYCLTHKYRFVLDKRSNFHVDGWEGFFEPFTEMVLDNHQHWRSANWRYALKRMLKGHFRSVLDISAYLNPFKRHLLTQDLFGKARDPKLRNKQYFIPDLGIQGDLQQACSQIVKLTWRYNKKTSLKIQTLINGLSLPDEYIGMHIRGGDKFVEHKQEAIHTYFDCIESTNKIKNLFVLTDDYSVIEEIKYKFPQWKVYTLCSTTERGYFHSSFIQQSKEFQQNQLIKLFASIEVLSVAKQFIGTFSSNPGMYLGMRNPEICSGVDFDKWLIW